MARPLKSFDLHVHTTASDGTMSPAEVVRYAKEKGIEIIAITDHDTIEGIAEGTTEGRRIGVEVIPGVEISVDFPHGSMHLLGYYIDPTSEELQGRLTFLQEARLQRNLKIIERLKALGIPLELSELKDASRHGQIGRPHFAYAMAKKGYTRDMQDAFDRYLGKGKPAYVEKFRFSPEEAIVMVQRAGGVAILAHPFTLNCEEPARLADIIKDLKDKGLDGVEVYYPQHSDGQRRLYQEVADSYGLLVTGGSDFHGLTKDEVDLGKGYYHSGMLDGVVEALRARHKARLDGSES